MRVYTSNSYPKLREIFRSFEDLGEVINKSRVTVSRKMNGSGFTEKEQILILRFIGIENTKENRKEIFTA